MKTTSSAKKAFNLGLASLVGIQSTLIAAPSSYFSDILDNSLMNVTPGGIINEKDSSGRIMQSSFHTGSFSFRFGGAFNYPQPIITLSPPKMSAGCGGLSIKGMFASVIGLDRFEEMLKNAGASLAWGIAVGLIYSLPGIGAAFRMIESWASKIQQLLANACQSGMAIGDKIGKLGFQDNAMFKKIAETDTAIADMDKSLQTKLGEYGISKYFDDKMVFSGSSASAGTAATTETISQSWKDFLISGLLYYSISTNALMSYLKTLNQTQFAKFIKSATGAADIFAQEENFKHYTFYITYDNSISSASGSSDTIFKLEDLLSMSALSGVTSSTGASLSALNEAEAVSRIFTTAAITRSAGSDLHTSNSKALVDLMANVKKVTEKTASADILKASEQELTDLLQGNSNPFSKATEEEHGNNIQKLAVDFVNYLYFGNTEGVAPTSTTYTTSCGTTGTAPTTPTTPTTPSGTSVTSGTTGTASVTAGVAARDLDILALGYNMVILPGKESNLTKIYVFYPTSKKSNNDLKYFKYTSGQEGAKVRSLRIIEEMVLCGNFSNINKDIPFLVPGIIDKMKIIQQSLPYEQQDLINVLADYNAYQIVKTSIVNLTQNNISKEANLPIVVAKKGDSNIQSLSKDFTIDDKIRKSWSDLNRNNGPVLYQLTESAMYRLKESADYTLMTPEGLNVLFKEQDLKNRKRQLEITPKSPGGY